MLQLGMGAVEPSLKSYSSTAETSPKGLPSLPVPPLRTTLDKFLKSVRPLVTDNEYRNTENLVIDFGAPDGVGHQLQRMLEKKASTTDNWLTEWWLNQSYLNFRSPVVVNSNPGMILPRQSVGSIEDQIGCASTIIVAALDYKRLVDDDLLPRETMGKAPLDMSQHSMIFGTCRIPGLETDSLTFAPPRPNDDSDDAPRHIVVIRNNNFFRLRVYDDDGFALGELDLARLLSDIVRRSSKRAAAVGILTSENRNVWGKIYKELRENPKNRRPLAEIQKCLFVVSLDNPNRPSDANFRSVAAAQFIHGGGIRANSGNRWFDKTIQFIVGTGGELGMCYEHSPAEGPPVAAISDHVIDFLTGARRCESRSPGGGDRSRLETPELLEFDLSNEVSRAIENAGDDLEIIIRDLELSCFAFESFGKTFIKSQGLSPDSFIQVAMQLAFYRIHKELGATYESASTRQYRGGRTEIIRSATSEALEFCKTMFDGRASFADRRHSMEVAVNAHKRYVLDAVRGLGVDRHLLGLKSLAVEKAVGVPELYLDAGYVRSTHFRISSSQVSARHASFMCYGPLVPDGYGCCYNPRDDGMLFGVSAYNSCSETSAVRFGEAIRQSLVDMHDVLVASPKARL